MKVSTVIGVTSLVVNAALLGALAVGAFESSSSSQTSTVAATTPASSSAGGTTPPRSAIWSELSSTDLAAERDRLAAEGFPPEAIRAMLAAQIRERSAARRKAIEGASGNQPFWKNPISDPNAQAQLRAIAKEEQAALKDLLGADPINSAAARLQRQFPDFPSEKINQLVAIRERYDEQRQEIHGFSRGALTPTEREQIRQLEKTMHGEFAAVLTPEELEHYDLRTSNTANGLRHTMSTFDPSEAEFRAVFRLQKAYDDQQQPYTPGMSREQMRARSDSQKQLQDQIAAALGPARYAEYQRSSDYNYRQTSQLVGRLGLPPETTAALYAVQKEFEERRNTLYRSATPAAPTAMNEPIRALQQEAISRVTRVLGGNATAADAYKEYGGSWITNMTPRTPVPTPPPPPPKK